MARGPAIAQLAESIRRPLERSITENVPPAAAPLVLALCLNMDGSLSETERDNLRGTGTFHLVSASGLHVFVVCGALVWALSRLPVPRGFQLLLLALPLTLYCLATGLEAPVLRASLMTMVGWSAYLLRRTPDSLNALGLAALLYLLWRPNSVFEIGTQLSFVTVGGILLFGVRTEFGKTFGERIRRGFIESLRLSTVAFVASTPLIAYYFQTVSLLAIPANLLVGLAASAVVVLGLLGACFAGLPWVGPGILIFTGWLASGIGVVTASLGQLPFAQIEIPALPAWSIFAIYGALLLGSREKITQP